MSTTATTPTDPASAPTTVAADDRPWIDRHERLARFAHLLALTGLTLAQPVLDSFATSPETFVYRRASSTDVVLFALLFVFALPTALWALEELAGLVWRPLRSALHVGFVCALFGVAGWQIVERHSDTDLFFHLDGVAIVAAAGTALFVLSRTARTILALLALSPVVVGSLWLLTGPIHDVAFAEGPGTTTGVPIEDPAPIVMIVLDEFPTASLLDDDGRVDETLFPGFARLADDATWYRNTSSVSPTTPEAVPAILTGRYPRDLGQPPTAATHPNNMFRALEGTYDLNVWELVAQLCPPEQCPALGGAVDQGLDALVADAADLWVDYMDEPPPSEDEEFAIRQSDPESPRKFEDFIASLEATSTGAPALDFIHLALPHQPWRHLPSGARHDAPFLAEGLGTPNYFWTSDYFAAAGRQRHLLQLQRADALLSDLINQLEDLDRYDESLVVVTADHGVAFDQGEPIRGLSEGNLEQIMWVPLFVKAPNQSSGSIDDRPMETVDVFPTIAEVIGMTLPWEVDGTAASVERTEADEARRFYPWKLNEVEPSDELPYSEIDGVDGYEQLLQVPPAGSVPRDDLQLYRIGTWGHLVGEEVDDLDEGSPAATEAQLEDASGNTVPVEHFRVDLGQAVLPVYVRGHLVDPPDDTIDVVVAVNGFVGGWGETFEKKDDIAFFALVPQQLLADGDNTIELYSVTGDPDDPTLHPITVDWAG